MVEEDNHDGDNDNNNNSNSESDDKSQNCAFNKRKLLLNAKTEYRSIAYDLVQFLIRYRYENNVR